LPKKRRSIYALGKAGLDKKEKIIEIIKMAVMQSPSAFNSQSARVVVLFDKESTRFWEITRNCLKKIVPVDAFPKTSEKIDSFNAGFGTVLFFEDQSVVNGLMNQYPLYKDNFPVWSMQSNGMLQSLVWMALAEESRGFFATL